MTDYILEMNNITKDFSGVKALDDVNFKVKRGEIHSICGENGAGKSTLMKILSGLYSYGNYDGDIIYDGQLCKFSNIRDSEEKGIVIIHQELALSQNLSIEDNIFLGHEITKSGLVDRDKTTGTAYELLKLVQLDKDPSDLVGDLGIGQQQLVEIAKAFSKTVKLLILDEPTSSLNESESQHLLSLLRQFKENGVTSIIISHKLNEVVEIADNVTIIRDGKTIETLENPNYDLDEDVIVRGMVGRPLTNRYPERKSDAKDVIFEVKNWCVHDPLDPTKLISNNINFNIRAGEIVGIAGLMGAGRTEFVMSMFGKSYGTDISGTMLIKNKEVDLNNVREAIEAGLAYVPEDRKTQGLNLLMDVKQNITLASLPSVSDKGMINKDKEISDTEDYIEALKIKVSSVDQNIEGLSGGNQQKVVIGKWLKTNPDILFLDEPTRGIDVGAKYEIYTIIQEMVASGKAVCVISSELEEVLGISDRIYTMNEGKITGEVPVEEANQEILMSKMTSREVYYGS